MNPETLVRLEQSAKSWLGTPWARNAAVKGHGVSCHMLIGRIYIEAGILPSDFAIPEGDPGWARAHKTSLIEPFIDACKHFQGLSGKSDIQPGDLLGFRIEGCLHHIGIVLTENRFVHCLRGQGVQYSRLDDATFMPRLMRVWRPV